MTDDRRVGRRLLRNSGLAIVSRILTAVTSLVAVPVVVDKLGVAGFGTWEALFAVSSLAAIFQSSISGALLWRQSEAYGRGDREEAAGWLRFGVTTTLLLLAVLLPIAWLGRYPLVRLLNVPAEFVPAVQWMFPALVAVIVLGAIAETLESVVSGFQRTGIVTVTTAAALVANYGVVIVGMLAGWGIVSCLIGAAVGLLVRVGAAYALARQCLGPVSLLPGPPLGARRATLRYSGLLFIGYVSSVLKDPTDKIILATLASPTWTGYYGIATRLAGLVLEFSRFFYNPLLTAVAALNSRGSWQGVRRLYDAMMTLVPIVTGCVVVVVAGLYDRLLVLWLGRVIPEVPLLLILLLTGNAFAVMLTGPGTALCRGIGRVGIETRYILVNFLLNLGITVVLVLTIGPIGTVVASGAAWALSSVAFVFVLHRKVDLPTVATRRGALALLCAAIAAGVIRLIVPALPAALPRSGALLQVFGFGMVAMAAYAICLWATGVLSRGVVGMAASAFADRGEEGLA